MEEKQISRFQHSVENNNKRAHKSGAIANLTVEEFEAAYIYFGGKCAYSGQEFSSKSAISIEHIIPIMSGGHSMAFNCVPVIPKYNSSKSGYHLLDWWKCQTDGFGNSVYNHFRLLKLLNYMIKCLEAVNMQDRITHILKDNEIDVFLFENKQQLEGASKNRSVKGDFRKISQLEVLKKMDMISIEDLYSVYSELDNIMLNPAIFFEEAIHELSGVIPVKILKIAEEKIRAIPDIYINEKKVFKKDMKPEDVRIRQQVLKWAEEEKLENKYGIIGYMDFEVLKVQPDVTEFLNARKRIILEKIGAVNEDFNNLINKVPDILTDLGVEERIKGIETCFKLTSDKKNGKSSELYKYITAKPDLLISGENMEILLKYVEQLNVDKRLLKKGIPITTIIDNIEMAIELVKRAELDADEKTKKRVLDKLINGTTGNLLRDAYRIFRKEVKSQNEELSANEVKRDAARWIVCISEKFNASEVLKSKPINSTRNLYQSMKFNKEGFMEGVNPNAYIVPKIISLASLDISRECEAELINNVFFVNQIRQGMRADAVLMSLAVTVKHDNPYMDEEQVMMDAARWFVFLSEVSCIHLGDMFNKKYRDKYIELTKDYYKQMKFDDRGNFIDINIPELSTFVVGKDYMKIADSYFKSSGDMYIIKGQYVPKREIQEILYEKLSKCKNKKAVKSTCMKMLNELAGKMERGRDGLEK